MAVWAGGRIVISVGQVMINPDRPNDRKDMSLGTILVILLILALIGVLPTWGYSSGWGYAPGGVVGLLLVVIIILALLGRL